VRATEDPASAGEKKNQLDLSWKAFGQIDLLVKRVASWSS